MQNIYQIGVVAFILLITTTTIANPLPVVLECNTAESCHKQGVSLFKDGKYLESIKCSKKAAKLRLKKKDGELWRSRRNIGLAYYQMNLFKEANKYFIGAYETNDTIHKNYLAQLLINIGDCYLEIGAFDEAKTYVTKALTLDADEDKFSKAHSTLAKILYRSGERQHILKAIKHADIALQTSKKSNNKVNIYYAAIAKGNSHLKLKQYDQALEIYKQTLKLVPTKDIEYRTVLQNNIATILLYQKKHKLSIDKLNETLIILSNHHQANYNYDYASYYENLGENYQGLEKFDTAIINYQKALTNMTNNFRNQNIFQNPNPKDTSLFIYSNQDIIQLLHLKATAAFKYYQQNTNTKYLNLANQTYQTAFNFHNKLQQEISTENSRLFQAKNIVSYIENALKVAYRQQENGEDVGETAFRFMEKNKATVLLQSMNEADALQFANLPDTLLEREKNLKIAISFHKMQLNDGIEYKDSSEIKRLGPILFDEQQQYRQLIADLEQNYPRYYRLKYQQNQTQLADVQNQLIDETALLEYFMGDSSIFILSIQKEKSKLYKLKKPSEWKQVLDDFRLALTDKKIIQDGIDEHQSHFTLSAYNLYKWLLQEPISDLGNNINRLQIIPDAELNYIPFELLLTEPVDTNKVNYKQLPYLLHQKSVGYVFSGAFLNQKQAASNDTLKSLAGFASNYQNTLFDVLPFAEENVNNITGKFNGDAFVDATKQDFFDVAQNYKTLFFAMHGELDDKNAMNSALVFSRETDSTDFNLRAADLYNTSLNAEMAVLSACETGLGKINKGEGVMSLSRAFTYAGCPSLVMSLWKIPNASTSELTTSFFDNLKKGLTKDKALQKAKLSYLESSPTRLSHPVYWAGLVATGDLKSIDLDRKTNYLWCLPILVIALGFSFWYFKK